MKTKIFLVVLILTSVFCIYPTASAQTTGTITVLSPVATETWNIGETHTIVWAETGISRVNISVTNTATSTATVLYSRVLGSQGSRSWKVPSTFAPGNYTITVSDAGGSAVSGASPAFQIGAAPSSPISVYAPESSFVWTAGKSDYIRWTENGITSVDITLNNTTTSTATLLRSQVSASRGYYLWPISKTLASGTYTITVSDSNDPSTSSTSGIFQIAVKVSKITVSAAGAATTVAMGSTLQMSAAALPATATNPAVTWSVTSGTGSAVIDPSTGLLTPSTAGTVFVTAKATDGSGIRGNERITISQATLASIAITTPATKLAYNVGDTLDITGLVVTGTYSDNTTQVINILKNNISGFNSSAANPSETLTINVGGKTASYTISVIANPVTPSNLSWQCINQQCAYAENRAGEVSCTGQNDLADCLFHCDPNGSGACLKGPGTGNNYPTCNAPSSSDPVCLPKCAYSSGGVENEFDPNSPYISGSGWQCVIFGTENGSNTGANVATGKSCKVSDPSACANYCDPTGSGKCLAGPGGSTGCDGVNDTTTCSATNPPVLSAITVSPTAVNLITGSQLYGGQQLTVRLSDQFRSAFSGATVAYVSSNPSVATVSSTGNVVGVSAGSTTITVTATSRSVNLTATSNITVTSNSSGYFSLSTIPTYLVRGQTYNLSWSAVAGINGVGINLFQNSNSIMSVASQLPGSGSYSWRVPSSLPVGAGYSLKFTGYSVLDYNDFSSQVFLYYVTAQQTPSFNIVTSAPTLTSIAVTTPATKLTYNVGDSLDITGLVVTGTNSDGTTQVEPITSSNITGFNSSVANPSETLTINVGRKTATYDVAISSTASTLALEKITITHPANKINYVIGDPLDITGLQVTGIYSDGSAQVLPISASNVSGFDSSVANHYEILTITYGDKSYSYDISINAPGSLGTACSAYADQNSNLCSVMIPTLLMETISHPASQMAYWVGDSFINAAGLQLTYYWSDNTTSQGAFIYAVSGFNTSSPTASEKITLYSLGGTVSYNIAVYPAGYIPPTTSYLASITVAPSTVNLVIGATQQLSITAFDQNGALFALTGTTNYVSSNPSVATVDQNGLATGVANGTATITITHTFFTKTVTTTANVTVNGAAPTLSSISITTPANKTEYVVGDPLDITGLVVTGTNSDGTTQVEPITASNVTGFNSSAANPSEALTVTYGGKTATYSVAVNAASTQLCNPVCSAGQICYSNGGGLGTCISMQIQTAAATNITYYSATLGGSMTVSQYVQMQCLYQISFDSFNSSDPIIIKTVGGNNSPYNSGTTALPVPVSGLWPNQTYHFRLECESNGGAAYGQDMTFTTLPYGQSESSDDTLKSLVTSVGTLSPAFSPNVLNYTVTLPAGSGAPTYNSMWSAITATTNDNLATMTETIPNTNGVPNNNDLEILVVAHDGTHQVYTVTFATAAVCNQCGTWSCVNGTQTFVPPSCGTPTIICPDVIPKLTCCISDSNCTSGNTCNNGSCTSIPNQILTSITAANLTLNVGANQQLAVTSLDQNGIAIPASGVIYGYTSNKPSVATVSPAGSVTGISAGTATITVTGTTPNANVTTTASVTVNSSSSSPLVNFQAGFYNPSTGAIDQLSSGPLTIASGASVAFKWSASSNVASCTASGGYGWSGPEPTSGSESISSITSSTTFTLTCTNTSGASATSSIMVNVTTSVVDYIHASDSAGSVDSGGNIYVPNGSTVTLNYGSANSTACSISNGQTTSALPNTYGSVSPKEINPASYSAASAWKYTLTCTGAGGATATASVNIHVSSQPLAPQVFLTALGEDSNGIAYLPTSGTGGLTVDWVSINATSCSFTGGNLAGSVALIGSATATQVDTYVLTCVGPGGSATGSVKILAHASTVSFTATGEKSFGAWAPGNEYAVLSKLGLTLSWSSANATSCYVSVTSAPVIPPFEGNSLPAGQPIVSGSVPLVGSASSSSIFTVATTGEDKYTITCTGAGGTASSSIYIFSPRYCLPMGNPSKPNGASGILNGVYGSYVNSTCWKYSCNLGGLGIQKTEITTQSCLVNPNQ